MGEGIDEERKYCAGLALRRSKGQDLLMDEKFDLEEFEKQNGPILLEDNDATSVAIADKANAKSEEKERPRQTQRMKRKLEEEARIKAEEDAKAKAEEEEARIKAEEDAKAKAEEEEARIKAEVDAKAKAEEEARIKAEKDARKAAEAKAKAEEEAKLEEEARKVEDEAGAKAETIEEANVPVDDISVASSNTESLAVGNVDSILLGINPTENDILEEFSVEGQDLEEGNNMEGDNVMDDYGSSQPANYKKPPLPPSQRKSASSPSSKYVNPAGQIVSPNRKDVEANHMDTDADSSMMTPSLPPSTAKSTGSFNLKYFPDILTKSTTPKMAYVGPTDDVSTIANDTIGTESHTGGSRKKVFPSSGNAEKRDPEEEYVVFMRYKYAFLLAFFLIAAIISLSYGLDRVKAMNAEDGWDWTFKPTIYQSQAPSVSPTTQHPTTLAPTKMPSSTPSAAPTNKPTTLAPSSTPSRAPSVSPTRAPSASPTLSKREIFETIFEEVSPSTIDKIQVRGSKEWLAFEWLMNDSNFYSYGDRKIVQRFALALFSLDISTTRRRNLSARRRHLNEVLDTWMKNHDDECNWYTSYYNNFVPCDKTGVFRHLVLINVQLDGTLPTELGLLTRLNTLILADNEIKGTLPTHLGKLFNLQHLNFTNNELGGTIPDELEDMVALQSLDFSRNNLVGQIPNELGDLGLLVDMRLDNNQLTGSIPTDLRKLNLLTNLEVADNLLMGEVQEEICNMNLEQLTAECDLIWCDCCDNCKSKGNAPSVTPEPTPVPTPKPTTPYPTRAPTTGSPTRTPTTGTPTRAPTTPAPTTATPTESCDDEIQLKKTCFVWGEDIKFDFLNCNPVGNDWIGVYSAGQTRLFDPLLWMWSCGSQGCFGQTKEASIVMNGSSQGTASWPLQLGSYKVWLFRYSESGPFEGFVGSETFTVQAQC